jgi:two-component system chemotaxis sensor kinase CheA
VSVTDDGAGVDPVALAGRLGIEVGEVRARLSRGEDLMEWLGRPGVSTASETGLIAGRGVGLDAARALLHRAGGGIAVRSEEARGTVVEIRISPHAQVTTCLLARFGGTLLGLPISSVARAGGTGPRTRAPELGQLLGGSPGGAADRPILALDGGNGRRREVAVDELLGRLDCVVRPLPGGLGAGIYLGTAMTGDGTPVAVLDPACLAGLCREEPPVRDADRAGG